MFNYMLLIDNLKKYLTKYFWVLRLILEGYASSGGEEGGGGGGGGGGR